MKEQNKRVKDYTYLAKGLENIKGRGRKIWYTTEFHDLAQSEQLQSPAALDPVISFKGNYYVRGCVTYEFLANL